MPRWFWWAGGTAVVVIIAAAAWLTVTGLQARDALASADSAANRLHVALLSGDRATAAAASTELDSQAAKAHQLTSDPVWRVAAMVPWVGRTPQAVSTVAADLAATAHAVLPDVSAAAGAVNTGSLWQHGKVNVAALAAIAPAVETAANEVDALAAQLHAVPLDGVVGPVSDGVQRATTQIDNLSRQLSNASVVVHLVPAMLGSSATRHYLVVLQNNAEARGTGGLVGAYAVVSATAGTIHVDQLGSDQQLRSAAAPVVPLGTAYRTLFGTDPALWANTNLSAHFPFAAVQQLELWRRQHNVRLDGVIAVDPVALGYLLNVAGPAQLDGHSIPGKDFADLTMRGAYALFPDPAQNAERDQYLQALAKAGLDRLLHASASGTALVRALVASADQRRLLVYSARPGEETMLSTTAVGGFVDSRPGPYAGLALDNVSGSKIDYYVTRTMNYTGQACSTIPGFTSTRPSSVTITLHNGAPAHGLPPYAGYRLDLGPLNGAGRGGNGSTKERALLYVAEGARLSGATIDGKPLPVTVGKDGAGSKRPVFSFPVILAAGQTRVIVVNLVEPVVPGAVPQAWVTPGVQPTTLVVHVPACG